MKKICFSWVLLCFVAVPALFAQATNSTSGRVFGWKVKSPTTTAYVVGSIHLAKPDLYPLNPKLVDAFNSSTALVVEVDVARAGGELAQLMMVKASYPAGDSIDRHVSPQVLQQAEAQLAKSGLALAMFAKFKPWFVAQAVLMTELQRLGFSPNHGIDVYFLNQARDKKKILELETADGQIDLLNSFSDQEQELFLLYTLKDLDNTEKNVNEILESWKQGDADRVEKFLTQSLKDMPELAAVYKKLIDDRNVTMTTTIEGYLKTPDTYFIVVGSAHIVGEKGLLSLLKKAGYSVEPL